MKTVIMVFSIGIIAGMIGNYLGSERDKLNVLRMENVILRDYKKMYISHVDSCHSDSIHEGCYKVRE
jgi:hypothetical protein